MSVLIPVRLLADFKEFSARLVDLRSGYKKVKSDTKIGPAETVRNKVAQIVKGDTTEGTIRNAFIVKSTGTINDEEQRETIHFSLEFFNKVCAGFDDLIRNAPKEKLSTLQDAIKRYGGWKLELSTVFAQQEELRQSYIPDEPEPSAEKSQFLSPTFEKKNDAKEGFQIDKSYGTVFLENELPRIIRKMPESDSHVNGIIFLDIDDLTVINKKFGHDVGNLVLDEIGTIIRRRSAFRYSGRCGDDTFYGVLFRTNSEKTLEICRKIKSDISYYPWKSIADKLRVTCTIGSAMMTRNEDPYSWLERSIIGMLEGKEKGGNIIQPGPLYLSKKEQRKVAEQDSIEEEEAEAKARNPEPSFSLRTWFS